MQERDRIQARAELLRTGHSPGVLAVVVIALLSAGLLLVLWAELRQGGALSTMIQAPGALVSGFALMMLLTIGYLVSRHWSAGRDQRRILERLLEEETAARSAQLNPLTEVHNAEVCREILLLQAHHAARLDAPLAVLEFQVPGLERLRSGGSGPLAAELIRELRSLGRPTDSLLRWSPGAFLMLLPELSADELTAVKERMRRELDQWMEERVEPGARPAVQWRGFSSQVLTTSGDILIETQRLLEQDRGAIERSAVGGAQHSNSLGSQKSIAFALPLEVRGSNGDGSPFRDSIVTERVGADRIWFSWDKDLPERSALTVAAAEHGWVEDAELVRWTSRGGERVAEVRLARTPERWVLRPEN